MTEKINKETIKHLAKLARIKLTENEENEFSKDLEKIINHFNELNEVNTSNISALTGGTNLKNVFRKDDVQNPYQNKGISNFPETKNKFLKVPKVL
jgi:aspartyl-tRNA(Asn)/glutamyl-tRNA(Gln) amidotransferase subunit C